MRGSLSQDLKVRDWKSQTNRFTYRVKEQGSEIREVSGHSYMATGQGSTSPGPPGGQ